MIAIKALLWKCVILYKKTTSSPYVHLNPFNSFFFFFYTKCTSCSKSFTCIVKLLNGCFNNYTTDDEKNDDDGDETMMMTLHSHISVFSTQSIQKNLILGSVPLNGMDKILGSIIF